MPLRDLDVGIGFAGGTARSTIGAVRDDVRWATAAGFDSYWLSYVAVPDVAASAAQAEELGGSIGVPPTTIPDVGQFAVMADPQRRKRICAAVRDITGGAPMVVNLEGVTLPTVPQKFRRWPLVMPEELTLDCLRELGVQTVSVANNHRLDLGAAALERFEGRGVEANDRGPDFVSSAGDGSRHDDGGEAPADVRSHLECERLVGR